MINYIYAPNSYNFRMPSRYLTKDLWNNLYNLIENNLDSLFIKVLDSEKLFSINNSNYSKENKGIKINQSDLLNYNLNKLNRDYSKKVISIGIFPEKNKVSYLNYNISELISNSDIGHIFYLDDSENPLNPRLELYEKLFKITPNPNTSGLIDYLIGNDFKIHNIDKQIIVPGLEFRDIGEIIDIKSKFEHNPNFEYIDYLRVKDEDSIFFEGINYYNKKYISHSYLENKIFLDKFYSK